MGKPVDIKVQLQTQLEGIKDTKKSLQGKGGFPDPKKLQQIEVEIERLQQLINNFNPKSNSDIRSVNSAFTGLYNTLIKVGLSVGNASEKLKQLYKTLKVEQDKLNARTDTRALKAGRLDESGNLTSKDQWTKQKLIKANIQYKNSQIAANPVKLAENVDKAGQVGWQKVFASEADYKQAQKTVEEIQIEEKLIKNDLEQLDKEIKEINAKIAKINADIGTEMQNSAIAPEVTNTTAQEGQTLDILNKQREENLAEEQQENTKANTEDVENFTKAVNKQSTSIGKALKQFSLYAIAYRSLRKAAREAVQTIKEIDRTLTEQAMVTGLTRKQTYGLLKDYQDMASRLGTTTKEISSTMTQFLRQGRSINESVKLTEAAVSAAKVAGISAADSINYLTTAINGFRLSADDAMKVSDKFAAVAASAATSYEEIAIALSKVAAQANLAGMSIDYTTALLTKGIETTREAPETIGTALKTVIARMRELGDYGETLAGDTDINNVETQLAYIGIQLRDNNGELRSTEDVLNELGGKWDDLNANQQAAIAKALAGTRQQSRLIAMMSDYERVIELQEIAERSQGATMAQMATYMEGLDAALNKVSVAWEGIVSAVTKSEAVIGIVNAVANVMESIGDLLSNDVALITSIIAISSLLLISLTKRHEMQKAHNRLILQQNKNDIKDNIQQKEKLLTATKNYIKLLETVKAQRKLNKEKARENLLDENITNDAMAQQVMALSDAEIEEELTKAKNEQLTLETEIKASKIEMLNTDIQLAQNAAGINELWGNLATIMTPIISIMSIINTLQQAYNAHLMKGTLLTKKDTAAQAENSAAKSTGMFAGIVSAFSEAGIPGVIAGIAIATALVAALGVSIAVALAATGAFNKTSAAEKTADDINKLSKEIYDLNKKATELNTIINKFEDLDNKVLKTNKDLKEMATLLESAADSLSDEEKDEYNGLTTNKARKEYLEQVISNANDSLASARAQQRDKILGLRKTGGSEWNNFLTSGDAEIIQARDAMYALNNAYLYTAIDALNIDKERAKAVETITQNMLEQLDAAKAAAILADQSQIDQYIAVMSNSDAASILSSDDYSITERVQAFEELHNAIAALGDDEILNAFETINKEWLTFSQMSAGTLEYIDKIGANIDGINNLANAIQKLGYTSEQSAEKLDQMFELLNAGENLKDVIRDMFGAENYDSILNAFDKSFGTTILNMGQNIDKFKNTIDSFYEKAQEWSTMSESDKTSFLSENAEMFKGTDGAALLAAFESGNYQRIAEALSTNAALVKQRETLLKEVNQQLEIELARSAEEQDAAYIKQLQDYKKQLEDLETVYLASLKLRYDQQQAQLDMYKEMLQKENDALTESLNKRKEAYEKYFQAINQEAEDEDYEQQVSTLVANISKLSSSTNADAMAKTADLTKKLEELEKERLQTLRERAQEAVLQSMEDEITKISDNLEKLLNNEQALLNAMLNDNQDSSSLIASLLTSQFMNGNNTELGMQSYLQQMQSTFASIMPGIDWSDISIERQGNTTILNIAGTEVVLTDGEQQTVYDAIQAALKQIGKR